MTDRQLIRTLLTTKEHEAWTLAHCMSQRDIALALQISRATVRARLDRAHRKIQAAKEKAA